MRKKFLIFTSYRSSHQRFSIRKGVFRNFAKFAEKHLYQNLFLIKFMWISVNFTKFLRTPFLQNTSGRLFLFLSCVWSWEQLLANCRWRISSFSKEVLASKTISCILIFTSQIFVFIWVIRQIQKEVYINKTNSVIMKDF